MKDVPVFISGVYHTEYLTVEGITTLKFKASNEWLEPFSGSNAPIDMV